MKNISTKYYITKLLYFVPFVSMLVTIFIIDKQLVNGIVSGKYFWFYGSMGLLSVFAIITTAISQKKMQITLLDGMVLLFGLSSLLFSYNVHHSEPATKQILLVLVIVLYFYFRLALQQNKKIVYWLTTCLIVTGLVEAIWGLRQLYGFEKSQHSLFRLTGSFFNPGPYACYLAVVLPVSLYYAMKYCSCLHVKFHFRNMPVYFLWGISALTVFSVIIVLPASMSRASWMAATGGCCVVLLYLFSKSKKTKTFIARNKKKCILIASVVLLIFLSIAAGAYRLKKDSADGRAFIWKNTIELIKQHPLGVGIGNCSYGHIQAAYFEAGKGSEDEERVAGNPEYAFNEYLQIFAELGIVVFILFIGIISYSLYIGLKRKKIAETASLVALLIAATASYPFSVLPFLIVLVFLLALINRDEKGIAIAKPASLTFAFCGLIIVSLCLYNRYPTYDAYKKWNKIARMYHIGNYKEAANDYRNIYPHLSDQVKFLFEYAQCLSKSEQYEESNSILKKTIKISCDPMLYNIMGKNYQAMKQYHAAEQSFLKASHIVPNRIYPYYLMALMYVDAGEMGKAKAAAKTVLTKEPKVQSTAVREMKEEAKKIVGSD